MKKLAFLGLMVIMLLPLLVIGCGGNGSTTFERTLDDFTAQNNIVQSVTLNAGDTLTVKLGSNPTTGFNWDDAAIGNTAVIEQVSRDYLEPTASGIVGAPGTDVWAFRAKAAGTTTIQFNYSRPWESEPATYTLTLNITVN
ncbi:MAG: protease inhibitor I42 family protein [Dehalococcoidales bacterium]|nr:protease inhibitor I42 family protein [Dehalococcoidales bacterium]